MRRGEVNIERTDVFELKTKYDLIVPFGKWCGPAFWLRKFCLRSCSLPFDWMAGDAYSLEDYVSIVCNDFVDFLQRDALSFHTYGNPEIDECDTYRDDHTGLFSCHDFPIGASFEAAWSQVRAKYDRRIARLFSEIRRSRHVLFVHIERCPQESPSCSEPTAMLAAVSAMRRKFPETAIDFIIVRHDSSVKDPVFATLEYGVYYTVGDYWRPDINDRYGNVELLTPIFRSIKLRGRWKNVLHRRFARWKMKALTCMHFTSEGRRKARAMYGKEGA